MIVLIASLSLAALLQQSAGAVSFLTLCGVRAAAKFANASTTNAAEQKIVDTHNALRRGVKPTASNMLRMEWNPKAAENSKCWARECTLSHSPQMKRTVNGTVCGENIFMSTATTQWSTVIQTWYDEEKYFKYGIGQVTQNAVTGHYTQVVWYNSYLIGCYEAHCPRAYFKHYYVCQYCPAGNIEDSLKTPYKSGPPCGDCPAACDDGLCTNPCRYEDKRPSCIHLAEVLGCENLLVKENCPASCRCTTEVK
ncbi:serotriflin-like [Elgaria multicarinata webbii]|uniref:serotriflin-like n=1 Tax=Elgaria multicarinata webbii TaxID=159646 RepID=UPI002FCD38AE